MESVEGALGPGQYQTKHIIIATGARPRVAGARARQEGSAEIYRYFQHAKDYGLKADNIGFDAFRFRYCAPANALSRRRQS